jgi:uncharacterized protein YndB with AHSA1/START domain
MTTKENIRLEIKRVINASRDRVYRAWTDPAQLKEWFGPDRVVTRDLIADVRVGGEFRWDLTSPEGEEMTILGEYRELIPGKKIVFSWRWDDDQAWHDRTSIVTIELSDYARGTELRLAHEQLPSEESRDRHSEGWSTLLDRLQKFLL